MNGILLKDTEIRQRWKACECVEPPEVCHNFAHAKIVKRAIHEVRLIDPVAVGVRKVVAVGHYTVGGEPYWAILRITQVEKQWFIQGWERVDPDTEPEVRRLWALSPYQEAESAA